MFEKIRILPILILLCCLMLWQRLGDIWLTGQAIAAEAAKAEDATPAETAEKSVDAEKTDAHKPPVAADANADAAKSGSDQDGKSADPLLFSDSELDILQSLSARREQLDAREKAIEQKEGLLQITEQRIEQKLEELRKIKSELEETKAEVEKLAHVVEGKDKERLAGLVKAYESMKPKDAARIFDELDMSVLMSIISQMKEAKMAPILATMDPSKAKVVTTALAQRKDLPMMTPAGQSSVNVPPGPDKSTP